MLDHERKESCLSTGEAESRQVKGDHLVKSGSDEQKKILLAEEQVQKDQFRPERYENFRAESRKSERKDLGKSKQEAAAKQQEWH